MRSRNCLFAIMALLATLLATPLAAQSTIGFGATVIIPIAVNSASYSTEVWVQSGFGNQDAISVNVQFYEAKSSTSPGTKYNCTPSPLFIGAGGRAKSFQLATQCALPAGSRHGLLVIQDAAPEQYHFFSAYSRVQNPNAIGFSIEGFPVGQLSPQSQNIAGLKRVQSGSPPFQTNCFVAALGLPVSYQIRLYDPNTNQQIGNAVTGSLNAYEMNRHLDIFAAAGLAAGDYANVNARIQQTTTFTAGNFDNPIFVSFCTVQDNTSFGADFRMGKSFDAWDNTYRRQVGFCTPTECGSYDHAITDLTTKDVYPLLVRPPDNIRCDIVSDRIDDLEIALGNGENGPSFTPFFGGGNDATGFYWSTGPRMVRASDGSTLRDYYPLQVSAREKVPAPALPIPYAIVCRSGNGMHILDKPYLFPDDF